MLIQYREKVDIGENKVYYVEFNERKILIEIYFNCGRIYGILRVFDLFVYILSFYYLVDVYEYWLLINIVFFFIKWFIKEE